MRHKRLLTGILAMAIAFTSAFAAAPAEAQAKSTTVQYVRLLHDTPYKKYDFTGDGKADSFRYNPIQTDPEMFGGLKVTVNGKKSTIPIEKTGEYFFNTDATRAKDTETEISFIRLKNGTTYLYCGFTEYNDYTCGMIFQYDVAKNKFYRKAKISSLFVKAGFHTSEIEKVSGNTIKFNITLNGTTAGYFSTEVTYGYVEDSSGKVSICPVTAKGKKKTDRTYPITSIAHQYYTYDEELGEDIATDSVVNMDPMTAKYKLKMYSDPLLADRKVDPDTESKVFIPVGTSVSLEKIYIGTKNNAFFVKTEDYGNGWIKDEKFMNSNDVEDGAFEESLFAG